MKVETNQRTDKRVKEQLRRYASDARARWPEKNDSCHHHQKWMCVFTVTSHSFLIVKGTSGTEITDTAGRMVDTNLSGWIYEWLESEGHVDGCVRFGQTLSAIMHPLWRHCWLQTDSARQAERWYQMPWRSTVTKHNSTHSLYSSGMFLSHTFVVLFVRDRYWLFFFSCKHKYTAYGHLTD